MVVNDQHLGPRAHALQLSEGLGIYQDNPLDTAVGQIIGPHEGQLVPVEGQEMAQVAVGPPGQNRYSFRI